jgi:hypothetical protein
MGLIENKNGILSVGKSRIHIDAENPNILKHHENWRIAALKSLDRAHGEDQHFSSVMSVSAKDIVKIKELWLEFLGRLEPVVRDSPEEEVYVINWDLFRI